MVTSKEFYRLFRQDDIKKFKDIEGKLEDYIKYELCSLLLQAYIFGLEKILFHLIDNYNTIMCTSILLRFVNHGRVDILQRYIDKGERIYIRNFSDMITIVKNYSDETLDGLKFLIDHGLDLKSGYGKFLLRLAMRYDNEDLFRFILSYNIRQTKDVLEVYPKYEKIQRENSMKHLSIRGWSTNAGDDKE